MKNIRKIVSLVSIAGIMTLNTACDGLLNMSPESTLSPDTYFENASELQLWTNQFYSQLGDAESYAATNADDNVDSALGELMMGQRSPASEDGWDWSMLRKINYYLQNSSNCKDAAAREQYDGVAYFMRAYFYFKKVQRYGDVPWYTQVLNSDSDDLLFAPRTDRGIVIDNILADLKKASDEMLPSTHDVVRVTKWTALALTSRIALYEGTFRKYHGMSDADKYLKIAADAAKEFIVNSGYKIYKSGNTPYRDLFNSKDAISEEVILTKKYSATANVMHGIPFNIINNKQGFTKRFMNHYLMEDGSYYSSQEDYATKTFVDEVKNRDPRLAQTILTPGYVQLGDNKETINKLTASTGYQPIKFVAESKYDGANKAFTDFPLFRTAEVYLNYAEALAELGTLTDDDLEMSVNELRDRVGMKGLKVSEANSNIDPLLASYYPNVSQESNKGIILEIRRERTIELAMEGFRIWDLLRWKEGAQLELPFYGCYFPAEGQYDMNGDGKKDILLYSSDKGNWSGTALKLGKDITLSDGTSGYVNAFPTTIIWNENRDYLWPIPASERVLTGGKLSQNPGWDDGLSY